MSSENLGRFYAVCVLAFLLLSPIVALAQPSPPAKARAENRAPKPSAATQNRDISKSVALFCTRYLGAIQKSYAARNYSQHGALSLEFARRLRKVPLAHLRPCDQQFVAKVRADGVVPYLTPLIDHGHRLARISSSENSRRFDVLAEAVRKRMASDKNPTLEGMAFLRVVRSNAHRAYSSNAAYATLGLSYSKFGKAQYARGGSPEQILQILPLYERCDEESKKARTGTSALSPRTLARCNVLGAEIEQALPGGQEAPTADDVLASIKGGIGRGLLACLAKADKAAEMIATAEEYLDCRRSEQNRQVGGSSFNPGGMMTGTTTSGVAGAPTLSTVMQGATPSGPPVETGDGVSWSNVSQDFSRPDGSGGTEQINVSTGTSIDPQGNATPTGTVVTVTGSTGTTQYGYSGSGGNQQPTSVGWSSNDGSNQSYQANYNPETGITTEVVTSGSEGVIIETYPNGEQNVIEVDLANEGEATVLTDADATAMPPSDYYISSCSLGRNPKKDMGKPGFNRLGPWIMPSPDAVPATDSCITEFASGTAPAKCPPSVAMCTEPPPPGSCGCGTPTQASGLFGRSKNTCAVINCGPEGSCNPNTGSCATSGSGEIYPGISVPIGPRPTLKAPVSGHPKTLRPIVLGSKKLWFPGSGKPGITGVLGARPPGAAVAPARACDPNTQITPC